MRACSWDTVTPPPNGNATARVQVGLRAHQEAGFAKSRCPDTFELSLCGQRDSMQSWGNPLWLHPTTHRAPVMKGCPTARVSVAVRPCGRHWAPVSYTPWGGPQPWPVPKGRSREHPHFILGPRRAQAKLTESRNRAARGQHCSGQGNGAPEGREGDAWSPVPRAQLPGSKAAEGGRCDSQGP